MENTEDQKKKKKNVDIVLTSRATFCRVAIQSIINQHVTQTHAVCIVPCEDDLWTDTVNRRDDGGKGMRYGS